MKNAFLKLATLLAALLFGFFSWSSVTHHSVLAAPVESANCVEHCEPVCTTVISIIAPIASTFSHLIMHRVTVANITSIGLFVLAITAAATYRRHRPPDLLAAHCQYRS